MKNRYIENLIKKSKQYAKTARNDRRWDSKLGIKVYHYYDPNEPKEYAWWDDLAFIHGSQQVTVFFVHPRLKYHNTIDDIVHRSLKKIDHTDIFSKSTPNYKYLGKNKKRKKIVSYTMNYNGENAAYYEDWKRKTEELCAASDYEQRCSISVKQYGYCRGVELCVPVEAINEEGLLQLKEIVLNHFKDPTYFQRTFGDYKYTAADWVREEHNKKQCTE